MSMTAAEVLAALFENEDHPFYSTLAQWVKTDRRFRTFAEHYHGKIRSKLRNAADPAARADLLFELEIGRWLHQETRFEVAYETFDARAGGPDYTVTYRINTRFNVEVRRIRVQESGQERVHKLLETVTDKTKQMPPSAINILVMSDGAPAGDDLAAAAMLLRGLAENKAENFFTRRGYKNAADFLRQFRQMSAILCKTDEENLLWLNGLAKHPLPRDLVLALERLSS
jgi:hypothetical protein